MGYDGRLARSMLNDANAVAQLFEDADRLGMHSYLPVAEEMMGTLVSSLGSMKGWCGFAVARPTNWRLAVARRSMSQRLIRDCRRDSVDFKDSPPLVSVDDLACLNAGPTSKNLRIGLPLDMQRSLGHLAMTMGAAPSAGCTEVEETLLAELMRVPSS